ncbi:uncharacterized protein F5891DRAFT_981110 [Suillus fuscotomentosus]|uniref:Uncharacterized protein n=1 Tax=Suillus fuscotomentosus TaxID=1912939 RepID=A0AAD4E4B1_9AGAM|nr:uncharacterized protein F5891DRAFT_981110 [Suillus fuscotomentosus]KAG1899332.1 hypothetical protein F5891DRAFT_981110 [Suillus fuscotomentosus]
MIPLPELDRPFELRSHNIFGAGMTSIKGHEPVYIHIGPLGHYNINLTDADGSMHIKSKRAIYSLRVPSKQYRMHFQKIFLLHHTIQLIMASAIKQPEREYKDFLKEFLKMKIIGDTSDEGNIWDCMSFIYFLVLLQPFTKFIFPLVHPSPSDDSENHKAIWSLTCVPKDQNQKRVGVVSISQFYLKRQKFNQNIQ